MTTEKVNATSIITMHGNFFDSDPIKCVSNHRTPIANSDSKILLGMSDSEVKRIMEFPCEKSLLSHMQTDIIKERKHLLFSMKICF